MRNTDNANWHLSATDHIFHSLINQCEQLAIIFHYVAIAIYFAIIFRLPILCVVDIDRHIEGDDTFLLFLF